MGEEKVLNRDFKRIIEYCIHQLHNRIDSYMTVQINRHHECITLKLANRTGLRLVNINPSYTIHFFLNLRKKV